MPATVPNAKSLALCPITDRLPVRALILGDRIETGGVEELEIVSTVPLAFLSGESGFVVLYKFGVAVLFGLSPLEEKDVVTKIGTRVAGQAPRDEESQVLEVSSDSEDRAFPDGRVAVKDLSISRLLLVADVLAKSVALARDERRVNAVFDTIEPFAAQLAVKGRPPWSRRIMLELIGETLLVQHRVSGRVAVEDKPDILWDRPDLARLYARLDDEYELETRAQILKTKIAVIGEAARALTEIIDADRSVWLTTAIIALIFFSVALSVFQIVRQ